VIYHGVVSEPRPNESHHLCYFAGMMVLSRELPARSRYRSQADIVPNLPREQADRCRCRVSNRELSERSWFTDRFDAITACGDRIGVDGSIAGYIASGGVGAQPKGKGVERALTRLAALVSKRCCAISVRRR